MFVFTNIKNSIKTISYASYKHIDKALSSSSFSFKYNKGKRPVPGTTCSGCLAAVYISEEMASKGSYTKSVSGRLSLWSMAETRQTEFRQAREAKSQGAQGTLQHEKKCALSCHWFSPPVSWVRTLHVVSKVTVLGLHDVFPCWLGPGKQGRKALFAIFCILVSFWSIWYKKFLEFLTGEDMLHFCYFSSLTGKHMEKPFQTYWNCWLFCL